MDRGMPVGWEEEDWRHRKGEERASATTACRDWRSRSVITTAINRDIDVFSFSFVQSPTVDSFPSSSSSPDLGPGPSTQSTTPGGATALVNRGATTETLMHQGGWSYKSADLIMHYGQRNAASVDSITRMFNRDVGIQDDDVWMG